MAGGQMIQSKISNFPVYCSGTWSQYNVTTNSHAGVELGN